MLQDTGHFQCFEVLGVQGKGSLEVVQVVVGPPQAIYQVQLGVLPELVVASLF